jgi:hypothetical protein
MVGESGVFSVIAKRSLDLMCKCPDHMGDNPLKGFNNLFV